MVVTLVAIFYLPFSYSNQTKKTGGNFLNAMRHAIIITFISLLLVIDLYGQTFSGENVISIRPDFVQNIYGSNDTIKIHLVDRAGRSIYFIGKIDSVLICRISRYKENKLLEIKEYFNQSSGRWLQINSDSNGLVTCQGELIEAEDFLPNEDSVFLTRPDPPYLTSVQIIKYRKTLRNGTWTFFSPDAMVIKRINYNAGVEMK